MTQAGNGASFRRVELQQLVQQSRDVVHGRLRVHQRESQPACALELGRGDVEVSSGQDLFAQIELVRIRA